MFHAVPASRVYEIANTHVINELRAVRPDQTADTIVAGHPTVDMTARHTDTCTNINPMLYSIACISAVRTSASNIEPGTRKQKKPEATNSWLSKLPTQRELARS